MKVTLREKRQLGLTAVVSVVVSRGVDGKPSRIACGAQEDQMSCPNILKKRKFMLKNRSGLARLQLAEAD